MNYYCTQTSCTQMSSFAFSALVFTALHIIIYLFLYCVSSVFSKKERDLVCNLYSCISSFDAFLHFICWLQDLERVIYVSDWMMLLVYNSTKKKLASCMTVTIHFTLAIWFSTLLYVEKRRLMTTQGLFLANYINALHWLICIPHTLSGL